MIDLYTSATPNGWKASCTLEELGLDYEVHSIDLGAGDQKTPEFLKMNPNGRIPVIVDRDENDLAVFSRPARSWCTWPKRRGSSCPRAPGRGRAPSSG